MNTTLKNIFVLTISSLGLFSCAVKIGDQQINLTPDITLDGNWSTGCVADGADSYIKSSQSSNGKLEIATFRYTGTRACDQSQLSFSVLFSGTYNVSGDNINLTGAKNYEWKIQSVVETPYEQTLVDSLNASSVCGSNTWAIGQAASLLGCQMSSDLDLTNVTNGTTDYGVYEIPANISPAYMQFEASCNNAGYGGLCPTSNDRPSALSGTVFYKQ